jgi:hypothetical protein
MGGGGGRVRGKCPSLSSSCSLSLSLSSLFSCLLPAAPPPTDTTLDELGFPFCKVFTKFWILDRRS